MAHLRPLNWRFSSPFQFYSFKFFGLIKLHQIHQKLTERSFEISFLSGQCGVGHLLAHSLGYFRSTQRNWATSGPYRQISSLIFSRLQKIQAYSLHNLPLFCWKLSTWAVRMSNKKWWIIAHSITCRAMIMLPLCSASQPCYGEHRTHYQ